MSTQKQREANLHDTDGTLFARYDTSLAEPARQRGIATMHLGAAWHQVAQTIDRMSRHESRLSAQIDKKRRLLADLIATRPQQAEPEPAPVPRSPQKATVQNEPNFDLSPDNATPISKKPAPPPLRPPSRPISPISSANTTPSICNPQLSKRSGTALPACRLACPSWPVRTSATGCLSGDSAISRRQRAEPPVTGAKLFHRREQVLACELRPRDFEKHELRVGAFP